MSTANAYAAESQSAPLTPTVIERRDLAPHDVLIEIAYSGICHSDIHTVRGEWGPQPYPLVPGHEIAGTVVAVGSDVTRHAVGSRVGVGVLVDSCGECKMCLAGDEQYCERGATFTYGSVGSDGATTQGGYSTHIVVTEKFVLGIPDGIGLDVAAPLLCAGITTYAPLRHWNVEEGTKVAIVGLGGLGHMAVKHAHAMGANVTVLSQSLAKRDAGLALGADRYFATSDPTTFSQLGGEFDLIVNTVSAKLDLDAYLSLLALDGAMVNVGAPPEPLSLNVFSLLNLRRSFAGSMIGGIAQTQEMLNFCAAHGYGAEVEVIAADGINDAYDRVLASDVRYRFVIDASTFS
jgi:uncharacterized zinc-type alcohol dehydrogenase-like protein